MTIIALFIAKLVDLSIVGAVLGWFAVRWWIAAMLAIVYALAATVAIYAPLPIKPPGAEIDFTLAYAAFVVWYGAGIGAKMLLARSRKTAV